MKYWLLSGGLGMLLLSTPLIAEEKKEPASSKQETATSFEVPYRLTDTKHVLVRLKLNGKGPFNFILDTGAPALIMSETIAKKTGVELKKGWGTFDKLELEGGLVIPKANGLATDMFQLKGMNAMGLAGVELHGVIGYNVLAKFRIQYDFTQDKLIWTPLKYEPPKMLGLGREAKGEQGGLEFMGEAMKLLAPLLGMSPNFNTRPRGFIGIEVEEKDSAVLVKAVLPGSPAEKAGLKVGDHIQEAKGRDVDSSDDLFKIAGRLLEGDKLVFKVKRGKDSQEITVQLGKGL